MFQVYMAFQSMLIVLIGSTPEYHLEQQRVPSSSQEVVQRVVFTEDIDSIVTEVSCCRVSMCFHLCEIKLVPFVCMFLSGSSSKSRLTR